MCNLLMYFHMNAEEKLSRDRCTHRGNKKIKHKKICESNTPFGLLYDPFNIGIVVMVHTAFFFQLCN